jgi:hypothetical protein
MLLSCRIAEVEWNMRPQTKKNLVRHGVHPYLVLFCVLFASTTATATANLYAQGVAWFQPAAALSGRASATRLILTLQPGLEIIEGVRLTFPSALGLTTLTSRSAADVTTTLDTAHVAYHSPVISPRQDTLDITLNPVGTSIHRIDSWIVVDSAGIRVERPLLARQAPDGEDLLSIRLVRPVGVSAATNPSTVVTGETLTWRLTLAIKPTSASSIKKIRFQPPGFLAITADSVVSMEHNGTRFTGVPEAEGFWSLSALIQPGESAVISVPCRVTDTGSPADMRLIDTWGLETTASTVPADLLGITISAGTQALAYRSADIQLTYVWTSTGGTGSVLDSLFIPQPSPAITLETSFNIRDDVLIHGNTSVSANSTRSTDGLITAPSIALTGDDHAKIVAELRALSTASGDLDLGSIRAVIHVGGSAGRIARVSIPVTGSIGIETGNGGLVRVSKNVLRVDGISGVSCSYLGDAASWSMKIYALSGRLVYRVDDHPANNDVVWNGWTRGKPLPTGYYILKFDDGERSETRRIILMR